MILPFVNIQTSHWLEISASIVLLAAFTWTLFRTKFMPAFTFGRAAGGISARHARRAAELAANGMMVADLRKPGLPIVYVNRAFERMTGYRQGELIGSNSCELLADDGLQPECGLIQGAIRKRQITQLRLQNRRKDGTTFTNDLYIEPLFSGWGRATHYIGTIRDVTPANENASDQQREDVLDRLTDVATRNTFHDQLERMLRRDGGQYTLLVKVDIRRFHDINTSFGNGSGDSLLRQTGQRLRTLPSAAIGRMSGDEFAIALPLPNPDAANEIISGIQALLDPMFLLPDATTLKVRFSIGYAVGQPTDECTMLLRRAGVALRESKVSPSQATREFDRNAAIRNDTRARLTRNLKQAIERAELLLHYQPKVDLATGEIIGAEALLRWNDPAFGLVEPTCFIPVAEDSGLIVDIGAWCLRHAADFVVRLNRGRSRPLVISVNVSQLQFEYSDVSQLLRTVIEETSVDPSWLMLELTERVLTDNSAAMTRTLRQLRKMGFGLSIDDFGTGYSSLSYLEAFPFSEFKIDRSFVSGLHGSRPKQVIVDAMIRLGKELQISVIAEGPETEEELSVLRKLNCPCVQGNIFGRPMAETQFMALVDNATSAYGEQDAAPAPILESHDDDLRTAVLLDDDPLVREVLGAALEALGWTVTPTATAEEALALSDVAPPPQLLVTDVNLGMGMSGFELLSHARLRWPDTGVVVISGRPAEPAALAALGPRETFLSKPASIAALSSAISRVSTHPDPGNAGFDAPVGPGRLPSWRDLVTMRRVDERNPGKALVDGDVALASDGRTDRAEACHSPALARSVVGRPAVTEPGVNLAAEVHRVLSQMARQADTRNVRLLVAIEPDLAIRTDLRAFRAIMSRILSGAITDAAPVGGRVLIAAFREQDRIQITVTDETEAANLVSRELTLRHADELIAIQDGSLEVRLIPGGGMEFALTLPAA